MVGGARLTGPDTLSVHPGGKEETPANPRDLTTHRRLAATVDTEVVGRRYYPCTVAACDVLRLVREPENPHDPNAVRVETGQGVKVGYLPRNCACRLADWLDGGALETAAIVHHHSPEDARWGLPILIVMWAPAKVELFGFPRYSRQKPDGGFKPTMTFEIRIKMPSLGNLIPFKVP